MVDFLVVGGGVAVFCASLWLISRAAAMWQVTALYAVPVALGMVLTGPMIGQILAVRLFQPRPGFALGVVTLGLAAGGLALPPIAARILAAQGWRDSIYTEIRGWMQSQGGLSIQRMCEMTTVSRASFYRHWKKRLPQKRRWLCGMSSSD